MLAFKIQDPPSYSVKLCFPFAIPFVQILPFSTAYEARIPIVKYCDPFLISKFKKCDDYFSFG